MNRWVFLPTLSPKKRDKEGLGRAHERFLATLSARFEPTYIVIQLDYRDNAERA